VVWGGVVWRADRDGEGTAEGGRPGCRSHGYSLSFPNEDHRTPRATRIPVPARHVDRSAVIEVC
jgi:hypothetical protein